MLLLSPTLVLGPLAGALADKHSRKMVMRLSCAVAAIGCLVGASIPGSETVRLGAVVTTGLIVGCAQSFFTPSWQALIPSILGTRKLLGAGALTRMAVQGGEFVGPLLAAPIVATLGIKPGYVLCALAYAVAGLITFRLTTPERPAASPMTVWQRVVEGIGYVRTDRRLAGVLTLTGFHCALTMSFLGLLPTFAAHRLQNAHAYGPLVIALGLGAIVGAFVVALFSRRMRPAPLLIVAGVPSGALLIALATTTSYAPALVFSFLAGSAQVAFMSGSYAVLQTLAPDHLRGRVASVSNMLNAGSMGLLGLAWGAIADATSVPLVLGALGAAFVVVMMAYMITFPALRTANGLEHDITTTPVI
jgi:MFS family permease